MGKGEKAVESYAAGPFLIKAELRPLGPENNQFGSLVNESCQMLNLESNYKEAGGRTVFQSSPVSKSKGCLCVRKTKLSGRKSISECVCGQRRNTEERWALMLRGRPAVLLYV